MSTSVLSREEAERIAVVYSPQKFPVSISSAATQFMSVRDSMQASDRQSEAVGSRARSAGSSFKIDKMVAEAAGIAQREREAIEQRVEEEALVRMKEMQEEAYHQAHQLGLNEGREKAFQVHQEEFRERLDRLESVISEIENLKTHLISQNEAHFVKLAYQIAATIAVSELKDNRELILPVIQRAISSAQSDEQITIRLSSEDAAFVESTREKLGKQFDALKNAKLDASPGVLNGGCVIETNYGAVDATIEMRLKKVWAAIDDKLPKSQDILTSEGSST
jgi:flagellar assembly protein FliH